MILTVQQIAASLGQQSGSQVPISGWSIDTRTLEPGDLFFALKGPAHDGNAYIEKALAKGAAAVIAERTAEGPVIVVRDSLAALQQLASWARQRWNGGVIGITGSAGKTSTKDTVAALLSTRLRVGKTVGNFNNHVGVPISILRLPNDAQAAVLEIGMNHAGEIRELAKIALPRIAVVTNVGYAHIEFFESIEGIALAKRELVEALPADGVAVLNADDPRVLQFRAVHFGRTITFGFSEEADVRAADFQFLPRPEQIGRHGVRNILAGIAVAGIYGIRPDELRDTIANLQPGKMRGERTWYHGILLLNDCYNSNPDAAKSMIDVLRDTPAVRRIAVLGEMLELGRWSGALHQDVARHVVENGIDVLVGIRGEARTMVDAAIDAGLPASAAYFFEDPSEAGLLLQKIACPGDAILFKGSRGTKVERALETFTSGVPESAAAVQTLS